jgi:opacity protein-like surface antigen
MKRFAEAVRLLSGAGLFAAAAMGATVAGSDRAFAQVGLPAGTTAAGCTSTFPAALGAIAGGQSQIIGGVVGVTNSVSSVIGTMNTAFLSQGNAFVAGLPNPTPDETSGGIWGRMIGGRVDEKASGTFTGSISASQNFGTPAANGSVTCNSDIRLNYGGFQLGQDIARLNIGGSGGTLHVGVTGGYAEANAQDRGGSNFTGNFQVPFAGVYAAYTQGRFFADILGRTDFYQMNLFAPDAALGNQRLNAIGHTVAASAGYRFDLGKDWFFEPSASGIYSKVKIDTLNLPEGFGNANNPLFLSPGTVQFGDNVSVLGRLGARVGTTINGGNITWQPFATASIWHEFAGNNTATYTASPYAPNGVDYTTSGALNSTRVGTYGQYSAGVAASVSGAPLLGYVRVDYRNGSNIEALGFNAGLRYNFDPVKGPVLPGIFKAAPRMAAAAYDWTGLYLGAFTGMTWGTSDWYFPPIGMGATSRTAGALVGGTAGFNKQFGPYVLGVEGDLAATNAKGGVSCISNAQNLGFPSETNCNNDVRWMATATGKFGYTWDRVMLYGKAGAAWANNKADVSCNGDPNFQLNCFAANNPNFIGNGVQNTISTIHQFGWTAGLGFELALTSAWSAKAEYDYINFGSYNVVMPDTTQLRLRQDFNQVKIGLNYHIGHDDAVVVARAMPSKAPPVAPYNWTGGYVGGAIAAKLSTANWMTTADNPTGAGLVAPDPSTTPENIFSSHAQGRLYAGYNYQFSPRWVAGIEGDVGNGSGRMRVAGIPGTYGNGLNSNVGTEAELADSAGVKMGWDGTIRGKLGMVVTPTVLFYGTGGVAFQDVTASAACDGSVNSYCIAPRNQSSSSVRTGWTAGLGLEAVLTGNWIGKVEARYADFGNYKPTFFAGTLDDMTTSIHVQTVTALAGVSYKFGPNVVVAKY